MHVRVSDGLSFYIGKGRGPRAFRFNGAGRSRRWVSTYKKHGCRVVLLYEKLSESCSFTLEKIAISKYKSMGHPLVNLTDGGEGPSGAVSTRRVPISCSNGMDFPSASHAALWLKSQGFQFATKASVMACIKKVNHMAYGYSWWRTGDDPVPFIEKGERMKLRSGSRVYCSNGMIFISASAAARWLRESGWPRATPVNVRACARGSVLRAYDLSWSFDTFPETPPKRVYSLASTKKPVVDSEGKQFESASDAARWLRENGYPKAKQGNISTACHSGRRSYGRTWKFL